MSSNLTSSLGVKEAERPGDDVQRRGRTDAVRAAAVRRVSHHLVGRTVLLGGLSLWISIAVLNNATDRTTNSFYLSQMTSMAAIHSDTSSGSGLLWRAIDLPWVGPALLYFVIVLQLCTAVLLLRAAVLHLQVLFGRKVSSDVANQAATIALSAFVGIWLFFMTGGFWFGYWLHMGAFQQVHMTLLIIGISSLIYLASTEPYLRNIS